MINLAQLFFDVARRVPTHPALVLEDSTLTYDELAQRAHRLASAIAAFEHAPHVGLLASKSETAYAGVLGILAAGSAYVPLSPTFPSARNAYIVEKAALSTLIVGPECASSLRALLAARPARYRVVTLTHHPDIEAIVGEHGDALEWIIAESASSMGASTIEADHTAYVLFTSGSTGQPKGVVVRHRNVHRYVASFLARYPLTEGDRLSQTFDLTFDLSVHDMFCGWAAGATIVAFPASALADPLPFAREHGVTVWFSVPAAAAFLVERRQAERGALPNVRLSLFCGEKLTLGTVRQWRDIAPRSRIVNLYGPTEATIAITHFEVPATFDEADTLHGVVPLGEPFDESAYEVRDEHGAPCARGEVGELWLSGGQIAAGYLDEPALTRERFVSTDGGSARYRTGDLVQVDERGRLQFVGRADLQVKFMGYRIELGEIEHALMRAAQCAHAIADVAALRNGVDELYAVLPTSVQTRKKAIKAALRESLPNYMIPRHFFFQDALPQNAAGKIDRRELRRRIVAAAASKHGA